MSKRTDMPKYPELITEIFNVLRSAPNQELSINEINEQMYKRLDLSDSVRNEKPHSWSYSDTEIESRLAHARTCLKRAGLIKATGKGMYGLTESGGKLNHIDGSEVYKNKENYLDYLEDKNKGKQEKYLKSLIAELQTLKQKYNDGRPLEKLLKLLLERMGFVNVELTRISNDHGVDLVATMKGNEMFSDKQVIFQCKQWVDYHHGQIGRREIADFREALTDDYDEAVFVTIGTYRDDAIEEARKEDEKFITLIDGYDLVNLLLKYEVLFKRTDDYIVDPDYIQNINGVDS